MCWIFSSVLVSACYKRQLLVFGYVACNIFAKVVGIDDLRFFHYKGHFLAFFGLKDHLVAFLELAQIVEHGAVFVVMSQNGRISGLSRHNRVRIVPQAVS